MRDIECVDDSELLKLQKEGVKVIDIRTKMEWEMTGIIEGSVLLTFFDERGAYDMESWLKEFENIVKNKDEKFVLVCAHANRTKVVGNFLRDKLGYKNVLELCGGIEYGWHKTNLTPYITSSAL